MEFSSGTGVPELMQLGPFEDESQIAAVEAAPVEQRIGVSTIYDAVAASAARHPDRIAVRFLANGLASDSGEDVSYARLLADMTGAANMFRSLGVGEEDVVAVMLPNLPEFYPAVFGACTAGIAFPINYLLEPDQIAALVRASRARVLVTVAPSFDREIWMRAQTVRDAMPDLHVFTVRGEAPGAVPFGGLVPSEALAFQPVRRLDRVVALLHTGGSTGHPKIARQTGRNLLFEAWVLGALRERAADANCVCAGPLFHAAGLVITGVMPLFWGATIVMLSPWGYRGKGVIGDLWKVVDKHKITHLTLVPTVLTVLAGMPFKPVPSLLYIGSGAAPLARALHDKFLGLSGYAVGQGYGMTEAGCAVTTTQHGATPFGSVGRRLPYVRVRIVIVDDGGKEVREANEGELGILAVSGPNVFAGYLGREDDKATWFSEGWLNTGDIGYRDREGFVWLVGRAKDIILRGGHNIDPRIIEEALLRLEGVKDAAAVGMPDAYAGELPIAFVVLEGGSVVRTEEQILKDVAPTISERAAIPKRIVLVDALPKTRIDKVDKTTLRAKAAGLAVADALSAAGIAPENYDIVDDPAVVGAARLGVRFPKTASDLRRRAQLAVEPLGIAVAID